MKKFNLALKFTLLFIAFLTFNFASKTSNNLTTKTNLSETNISNYSNQLVIFYSPLINNSEKAQIRACISSQLNAPITNIYNCPNGYEILTFDLIRFELEGRIGFGIDDDEQEKGLTRVQLNEIFAPCGNNFNFGIHEGNCNTINLLFYQN
ncbi:hypothetical protein [Tenacibaculum ovolyticum]|uniref:hypothetical protein n=1 Tax=Tenacibaculum ovolyticum TaxID=104270 RepID=UPI00041322D4|nr:hypothetical protein [Tenacibaculum ovolyticum]